MIQAERDIKAAVLVELNKPLVKADLELPALGHPDGGVVQEISPGVTHVEPGEHVVMHCRNASIGPSTRRWPPA